MLFRYVVLYFCLIVLAGCAGSGQIDSKTLTPDREVSAAWEQLESNPGVAGTDYNPRRILLHYVPGAQLPADWPTAGQLPAGQRAADQPNPMLRHEQSYELLTDAVAVRYRLAIKQQVYLGQAAFASFEVPDAVDSDALLVQLRSDLAGLIQHAVYVPLRQALGMPSDPDFAAGAAGPQWGHWKIECQTAWNTTMGDPGTMIAVVDTGVRLTHEELAGTVIDPLEAFPAATCDIVNGNNTIEDYHGHGSFIAGIVAAEEGNGRSIVGVAPHCSVLPIKIANDGWASSDDLIAGAYLADLLGARAINYSWGSYNQFPLEEQMVDAVTANGTLFVAAAGNDGIPDNMYPAAYPNSFTTGSTNQQDICSGFSNFGTYVDIAAPGQELKSCSPLADDAYELDGAGTSYAAPMVAAAAGLLWSYRPELTLAEVQAALSQHGPPATLFPGDTRRLDIAAALESVILPTTPLASGVSLAPFTSVGSVAGTPTLNLALQSAKNVVRATYTLDNFPYGSSGPEDRSATSTAGPAFQAGLDLTGLSNQTAQLRVDYFSATNEQASILIAPVWVFNQRGDVDGDGAVSLNDVAALGLLSGVSSGELGYVGYADTDLDGRITELDAASIGYFFGNGAMAPLVIGVTPASAVSALPVAFTAVINGGGPYTFAWDFGGGAVPNTTTEAFPLVTAGAEGNYNCTLTVSNSLGSTDYPFQLAVDPRPLPTARLNGTPTIGLAPVETIFDAGGSTAPGGSIDQYEWSWDGDTVFEDTTTTPANSHTFDTLGAHTVLLRVTDDLGRTAETLLDVTVVDNISIPDYGTLVLGDWGQITSDDTMRLNSCEINNRPAVAWVRRTGSPAGELYIAVAKTSQPETLAAWRVEMVYSGDFEFDTIGICAIEGEAAFLFYADGKMRYGRYQGDSYSIHELPVGGYDGVLANIAGVPAALYQSGNGHYYYLYANSPAPDSSDDWTVVAVNNSYGATPATNIPTPFMEIGGVPMFGGSYGGNEYAIVFATQNPPTADSWGTYIWENDHTSLGFRGRLYNHGGLPGVMLERYSDLDDYYDQYAVATTLAPTQAGDWVYHSLPASPRVAGSAAGIPVFRSSSDLLYMATSSTPDALSDWVGVNCKPDFEGFHIVNHSGLPAFLFRSQATGSDLLYRYPKP